MKISRLKLFVYLLPLFLVYSTITSFTIYNVGEHVESVIVFLLCVLGFSIRPHIIKNKPYCYLFFIGWVVVFLMSIILAGTRPGLPLIVAFLFCLFFLFLKVKIQKKVFKRYVFCLTIFVLLSAIEYIIYTITGKGIVLATVTRSTSYKDTTFDHFVFNIVAHTLVPRFQGLFKEPGNMGTMCAFMMLATWKIKSMRYSFFVFLICGLLSLSLAFYVFLLVFFVTSVKPTKKNLVAFMILMIPLFFIFKDSFVYRIVDRVDKADNVESLDNRTSWKLERAFNHSFETGELWLGVGINNIPKTLTNGLSSAGAKKWIYQYGIISFIIIFFVYNAIYYQRCGKRLRYNDWVFLFLYWACFYKTIVFTNPSLFVIYALMPVISKMGASQGSSTKVVL